MNQLKSKLISEIQDKGPVTFERFMEIALYDPRSGYYSSGKAAIGKEGDFYTSPAVHSAFGKTVSDLIVKLFGHMESKTLRIIEIGGGKGLLSLDILDNIKAVYPRTYSDLKYTIVEPGKKQVKEGKELLSEHKGKVEFKRDIADVEKEEEGIAISNELFDSLPFHRIKLEQGKLAEIYVSSDGNELFESTGELSDTRLQNYVEKYQLKLNEGQQIEISLRSEETLKHICSLFNTGAVITIDYGYLSDRLFTPDRPRGTFKCHFKHSINEEPYSNIGDQDITCHVDFTNIIQTGRSIGLKKLFYKNQGQFLVDWGILENLMNRDETGYTEFSAQRERLAIKNLILPQLMGNVFKVLVQIKNLDNIPDNFYPESELRLV